VKPNGSSRHLSEGKPGGLSSADQEELIRRAQARPTFGDLKVIQERIAPELAKLECGTWAGICLDVDRKTWQPIVVLVLRKKSRFVRWLYRRGFLKYPDHPETVGGLPVKVEVRGIAYLGGPPSGPLTRLVRRIWRAVVRR